MEHHAKLPEVIPVFPLPGALLLPRSRLPLHLFEPRYLAMFDDALRSGTRLIGMVQPSSAPAQNGAGLHRIGCAGRITQFSETEDGRYMITLTGQSRFRVVQELDVTTPYRQCEVSWAGFDADRGPDATDEDFDRFGFLALLEKFFETRGLAADMPSLTSAGDELLVNSLSMLLDFDAEEKQALLEAPCLRTRRETRVPLIERDLRGGPDSRDTLQ